MSMRRPGSASCRCPRSPRWRWWRWPACSCCVAGDGPDEVHALSLLAPAVFGAAILVFARERGALSKVLQVRPLRALGRWSYSIYMVHMPILLLLGYVVWLYGDLGAASLQVDTVVEGHVKQLYDLGDPVGTHLLMLGFLVAVVASGGLDLSAHRGALARPLQPHCEALREPRPGDRAAPARPARCSRCR